jgi:hypothetical protein
MVNKNPNTPVISEVTEAIAPSAASETAFETQQAAVAEEAKQDSETEAASGAREAQEASALSAKLQGRQVPEAVSQSSLKESFREILKDCASIGEVAKKPENLGNKEVFTITIHDKEKLKEEMTLRALIPHFGKMAFEIFSNRTPEDPPFELPDEDSTRQFVDEYFRQSDLGSTDKIYVMAEEGKVAGFFFLKNSELENGDKIDHILLTSMDGPFRGSGMHKQLTRTVFENENVAGFTALTHTPELVKSFVGMSQREGFDAYFCNKKNGNAGIPLTEKEKETLKLYRGDIDRQVSEYEFDDLQTGLPDEYTSYGKDAIPQRRLEEVKLPEGDPIGKTFRDMIGWGDSNRPGETLYGSLYMVKKPTEK